MYYLSVFEHDCTELKIAFMQAHSYHIKQHFFVQASSLSFFTLPIGSGEAKSV